MTTKTDSVAAWQEWLTGMKTPADWSKAMADGSFKMNLEGYLSARTAEAADLAEQAKVMAEATITEWLKDGGSAVKRLDFTPAGKPRVNPARGYNPKAFGAPLDGLFSDFTSLLQSAWHGARNHPDTAAKIDKIRAYSEKVPEGGGFLVPEEFRSSLMQLAMERAIVRPRATVIPMGAPRLHMPMIDETSRVSSIFGGIVVYRSEEGAELVESQAAFGSVKLDVTKQTALAHVGNELIRDWGAFTSFIDTTFPAAIAYYEDLDFLVGSGVGAPLGALNSSNTALLAIAGRAGQAASTIVWENIVDMYSRMLPSSIPSAVWIASPDALPQLMTMGLSIGTGGVPVWLPAGQNSPYSTLMGLPVLVTEKAPGSTAASTQGDISLVDFGMYLIGDYQAMSVESSPHVKFTSDRTTFRVIARNDGRPWLQSPLTPHNGSATLSPFVTLAAR